MVIAPEVLKVGAQKNITAFAGNAFHNAHFQVFRPLSFLVCFQNTTSKGSFQLNNQWTE
jgi:hypothetical protein